MADNDENSNSAAQAISELYDNGEQQRQRPIMSAEHLDVEAYASLYSGRTKIVRLLHIADRCNNGGMQLEALRIAYDEAKKREDVDLFREVATRIDGRLGEDYGEDSAWIEAVERRYSQRKEKLVNELNLYKSNLIKESIRMAYTDLGDLYYAHGQLGDALKNYILSRNFCSIPKQHTDICLNAILLNIEMGHPSHVASHVAKAGETRERLDPIIVAKLDSAFGLANLKTKSYKLAARKFLEVGPALGNQYSEMIAPQDISTYGALCALATFDRSELKKKVIDNVEFKNLLELVPEIRELINDFYLSQYASCLEYLGNLKANLLLDVHLHDHVETLYNEIRKRALINYTLPFVSVDLNKMATAFKTTVAGLQKELEALITSDQIQARIDSHNKILYARHADQRKATFQRVLQTGKEFNRDTTWMLLRANIMKHNFLNSPSYSNIYSHSHRHPKGKRS